MKKINDGKLYLYFSTITAVIGIILTIIFAYSTYFVEPEIEGLLEKQDNISDNFRAAYLKLKDPQIFARYENYDSISRPIESIITVFDKKIESGEAFEANDKIYLHVLLERRKMGAQLTRNTFIFFYAISLLGWIFYISELMQNKKNPQ